MFKDGTEFLSLAGLRAACEEASQATRPNAVLNITLAAGGLGIIECSDRNCSFGSPIQRTSDAADDRWRLIGRFVRTHNCLHLAVQVQQTQPAREQEAAIPDVNPAPDEPAEVKDEEKPDDLIFVRAAPAKRAVKSEAEASRAFLAQADSKHLVSDANVQALVKAGFTDEEVFRAAWRFKDERDWSELAAGLQEAGMSLTHRSLLRKVLIRRGWE